MPYLGETVICSITVVDNSSGVQRAPATSMLITIKDSQGALKADNQAMTESSAGEFYHACNTAGWMGGLCRVIYTAVDGSRITIQKDKFTLV